MKKVVTVTLAISGVNGVFSDDDIAKVVALAKKARARQGGNAARPARAAMKKPDAGPKVAAKKAFARKAVARKAPARKSSARAVP
jgi:hypothetical protein